MLQFVKMRNKSIKTIKKDAKSKRKSVGTTEKRSEKQGGEKADRKLGEYLEKSGLPSLAKLLKLDKKIN